MRGSSLAFGAAAVVVAAGVAFGGYAATAVSLGRAPLTVVEAGTGASAASSAPASPVSSGAILATPSSTPPPEAPLPTPAAVAAALAGPLADPALGAQVLVQVNDATTGQVLFTKSAATPATPASTAKIATAAATLATHASTDRITTTVVAGATAGTVVLVGAGDPTLSGVAAGAATPYDGAARISDLAAQLKGTTVTAIQVDGRLFTGPSTAPTWQKGDVPTDYASPITSVMADGGRDTPTAVIRSANPDLAAGIELAADLGLPATKVTRGAAPAAAKQLASVQSATYGQLVEEMLRDSDNVIAEVLGRQVAVASHQPVSFVGAAAATRATLSGLGTDIGTAMSDSSGLAAGDKIAPAALIAVLGLALQRPALRPVVDDLPVADWNGTLAGRFAPGGPAAAGAGLVRAKTGTLTSVSTLAGIVTTAKGRQLVFAFMAPKVGPTVADTNAAESALDVIAAALVGV